MDLLDMLCDFAKGRALDHVILRGRIKRKNEAHTNDCVGGMPQKSTGSTVYAAHTGKLTKNKNDNKKQQSKEQRSKFSITSMDDLDTNTIRPAGHGASDGHDAQCTEGDGHEQEAEGTCLPLLGPLMSGCVCCASAGIMGMWMWLIVDGGRQCNSGLSYKVMVVRV
jgi:hypothetical protein